MSEHQVVPATSARLGRLWSGIVYHQGPANRPLVGCAQLARWSARYHRAGTEAAWYSSSTRAALAKELRKRLTPGLDLSTVLRMVGSVHVHGQLLVLDDETMLELGVTRHDLTGDSYDACHHVADVARAAGLEGLVAPSAVAADSQTIVVFRPFSSIATILDEDEMTAAEFLREFPP